MKTEVVDFSNNKVGEVELDPSVFEVEVRPDIMARVVKWQLAKARTGNHLVKTRATVSHTTRKPFKQKGTGRARQGMTSVPNMRGGGVAFGPVLRDHNHSLPKKVRKLGLKSAISSKVKDNKLLVVKNLDIDSLKTKDLTVKLSQMDISSAVFVDTTNINDKFKRASANIIHVNSLPVIGLNVYDILKHDKLVITEDAVKTLTERLNGN